MRERWGRDVLHCAYCHGWEVRDRAVGILASGPMSVHQALLFRQLTDDVTFFAGDVRPDDEQAEQLAARGIRVVDGAVAALEIVEDRLVGVRMGDGAVVGCEAVVVSSRMVARAGFLDGLGLRTVEHPSGMGEHVPCRPDWPHRRTRRLGRGQRHRPGRAGGGGRVAGSVRGRTDQRRPGHGGDRSGRRRATGRRRPCPRGAPHRPHGVLGGLLPPRKQAVERATQPGPGHRAQRPRPSRSGDGTRPRLRRRGRRDLAGAAGVDGHWRGHLGSGACPCLLGGGRCRGRGPDRVGPARPGRRAARR